MIMMTWGLLGPESLFSQRRTRTLELGAVVRAFNERAVPGMGGVWFAKQLFLATLGVTVAEQARRRGQSCSNIQVANAIEALACWLAFSANGWRPDARLRGGMKMPHDADLSFATVGARNFYVIQPMRVATVQALPALGLVESRAERFNAFRCVQAGRDLIDTATAGYRPHHRSVLEVLVDWVCVPSKKVNTPALRDVLSPLEPLSAAARELLHHQLVQGGNEAAHRRGAALEWMESLRSSEARAATWQDKPPMLDMAHWLDLYSGALFSLTRDAAIAVLDQIEEEVGGLSDQRLRLDTPLPPSVTHRVAALREHARMFIEANHDPTPADEASRFCRECLADDDADVIRRLLVREGRVLRLRGEIIVPGAAFVGARQPESASNADDEGAETQSGDTDNLPEAISLRMQNLFRMNLDLKGELGNWMLREEDVA